MKQKTREIGTRMTVPEPWEIKEPRAIEPCEQQWTVNQPVLREKWTQTACLCLSLSLTRSVQSDGFSFSPSHTHILIILMCSPGKHTACDLSFWATPLHPPAGRASVGCLAADAGMQAPVAVFSLVPWSNSRLPLSPEKISYRVLFPNLTPRTWRKTKSWNVVTSVFAKLHWYYHPCRDLGLYGNRCV